MARGYSRYWTIKYPDGFISAFECLSLFPNDARKKIVKARKKSWPKLKKEGFQCIQVLIKEVRP